MGSLKKKVICKKKAAVATKRQDQIREAAVALEEPQGTSC